MNEVLKQAFTKIKKDASYIIILLIPLVVAIFIRITIPFIDSLNNYLKLFDVLVALLITIGVSLVISLLIIEDLEEYGSKKLLYTNKKINNYLSNRLLANIVITVIYIFLVLLIIPLSNLKITDLLILSILDALAGVSLVTMTVYYSNTKEQVFKYMSLSSIYVLGAMLPFLIFNANIYYFGVIPTLWISKYFHNGLPLFPFWSIMISIIWIMYFRIKFYIKHK